MIDMIIVHKIHTDGISTSVPFIILLAFFLISCEDDLPTEPHCSTGKSHLIATASETTLPTSNLYIGACDMSMEKFPNDAGGYDSIFLYGIFGFSSDVQIKLYNIRSGGEYKFNANNGSGETRAVCNFRHTTYGYDAFHDYSTKPIESGWITVDSLTSDYIKGTFEATLFSEDSVTKAHLTGGDFLYIDD